MGEIKKIRTEKVRSAFSDLSKAAYNAGLTFKEFSAVIESLDEEIAIKEGSVAGEALRLKLLNEPDRSG